MEASNVIGPSRTWLRRGLIFSGCYLLITLIGGSFVPWVFILTPIAAYHTAYAWIALRPGKLAIELFDDRLVTSAPFSKTRTIKKQDVLQFVTVYKNKNELVVARCEQHDETSISGDLLFEPGDIAMPCGLMKHPELVRALEGWRLGRAFSLKPPPVESDLKSAHSTSLG